MARFFHPWWNVLRRKDKRNSDWRSAALNLVDVQWQSRSTLVIVILSEIPFWLSHEPMDRGNLRIDLFQDGRAGRFVGSAHEFTFYI